MNKFYRILLILMIIIFIIFFLSEYKSSRSIDDLAYVLAIGIDKRTK